MLSKAITSKCRLYCFPSLKRFTKCCTHSGRYCMQKPDYPLEWLLIPYHKISSIPHKWQYLSKRKHLCIWEFLISGKIMVSLVLWITTSQTREASANPTMIRSRSNLVLKYDNQDRLLFLPGKLKLFQVSHINGKKVYLPDQYLDICHWLGVLKYSNWDVELSHWLVCWRVSFEISSSS